jgi:hypothetical protein
VEGFQVADNEYMSLLGIIIFGIILLYVGVQIPQFGFAFILGGIVAFVAALLIARNILS